MNVDAGLPLLADFVAEVGNYQREGPTRTS